MKIWPVISAVAVIWMISIAMAIVFLNEEITAIKASYTHESTVLNLANENKYSEYVWEEMPLTYNYDSSCDSRANKIESATKEIERLTSDQISFVKVNENEDIKIVCDSTKTLEEKDYLGKATVKYLKGEEKIVSARVNLYEDAKDCEYPYVEIHELLHLLGQGHNDVEGSVMKAKQNKCLSEIDIERDKAIFDHLKEIY